MRALFTRLTLERDGPVKIKVHPSDLGWEFCKILRHNRTDRKIRCDWSFSRHSIRVSWHTSLLPPWEVWRWIDSISISVLSPATDCLADTVSTSECFGSSPWSFKISRLSEARFSRGAPPQTSSSVPLASSCDTCLIEYERSIKSRKASSRHRDYPFRFHVIPITRLRAKFKHPSRLSIEI